MLRKDHLGQLHLNSLESGFDGSSGSRSRFLTEPPKIQNLSCYTQVIVAHLLLPDCAFASVCWPSVVYILHECEWTGIMQKAQPFVSSSHTIIIPYVQPGTEYGWFQFLGSLQKNDLKVSNVSWWRKYWPERTTRTPSKMFGQRHHSSS